MENISVKIIDILLTSSLKVNKKHMEQLKTLVNTSPNPTLALELLLGVYEMPNVVDKTIIIKGRETPCKVISYNPVKERVNYSYEKVNAKQFWVNKEIEKPILPTYKQLAEEQYDHYNREKELIKELNKNSKEQIYIHDFYKSVYIFSEEKGHTYEDYMSLKRWEERVDRY